MANLDAKGFGAALRKAREAAGRDIPDLAETTRIQGRYLEALEAEDWSRVPRGVIGRGFVRGVAKELGIPAAELIQLYRAARGDDDAEPERSLPEVDWKVDLGSRHQGKPLAFAVVCVAIVALGVWRWSPWDRRAPAVPPPAEERPAATATAPAPSAPRAVPAAPASAALTSPTPPVAPVAAPRAEAAKAVASGAARLEIEASDRVWVRVEPEGGEAQERVLKRGERATFVGSGRFQVKASNGAAVKLYWNGEALGAAGTSSGVASLTVPADPAQLGR